MPRAFEDDDDDEQQQQQQRPRRRRLRQGGERGGRGVAANAEPLSVEWSCPLCTLINSPTDDRCLACDQERPPPEASVPVPTQTLPDCPATQTLGGAGGGDDDDDNEESGRGRWATEPTPVPPRRIPGIFFMAPSTSMAWREAPRLLPPQRLGAKKRPLVLTAADRTGAAPPSPPLRPHALVDPTTAMATMTVAPIAKATDAAGPKDEFVLADAPSFCLLGSLTTPSEAPVARTKVPPPTETPPSFGLLQSLVGSNGPDAGPREDDDDDDNDDDAVEIYEDPDAKLARAGLQLSDSDSDDNTKGPRTPSGTGTGTWECPVCTNFNALALERCELCDTRRVQGASTSATAGSHDCIDLAHDDDNDEYEWAAGLDPVDTPYSQVQPSPDFEDDGHDEWAPPSSRSVVVGDATKRSFYEDDDVVEDISDHEAMTMEAAVPPRNTRPELRDFAHFVCVEDLAYGCEIDYRGLFAESKRGKSYEDRLQKRKRESQKRKKLAATASATGAGAPTAKRGKKAKGGKGKAPAAGRRASTGATTATKQRGRKAGATSKRSTTGGGSRQASAPTFSSGINHYDAGAVDFGDDVTTMAWEGVGSAGYF